MKWLRDFVALLLHTTDHKADVTDQRARRQWRKVREGDKVLKVYRELDDVLELRLHVRK